MNRNERRLPSPENVQGISSTRDERQVSPLSRIIKFLDVADASGVLERVDPRKRALIDAYFRTATPLSGLTAMAGVNTREGVRQLIVSGIKEIWQSLPSYLKDRYTLEEVTFQRKAASRAKMSEAHKGRQSPMKGRQHSPEARAKMSEARKGRRSPMRGRQHSPEARAKMSEAHKGRWARRKEQQGGIIFDAHR